MGEITLNYDDSMRILNDPEAGPDARVIAACFVAFFNVKNNADEIESSTRAIALKLSHMVVGSIYDTDAPPEEED